MSGVSTHKAISIYYEAITATHYSKKLLNNFFLNNFNNFFQLTIGFTFTRRNIYTKNTLRQNIQNIFPRLSTISRCYIL